MHRILIADDNEINRVMLADMLEDRYELVEAVNGLEVLSILESEKDLIDLVLLDIVMPEMDGLEVLNTMQRRGWLDEVPVIMISAETSVALMRRAYDLGAEDYVSRPFDAQIVCRRIRNTLMLHSREKQLREELTQQLQNREKQNGMMVSILSHIVECRNGESGEHVLHINAITGLLLDAVLKRTSRYALPDEDISLIRTASSFHDIGKLGIPGRILNKPGRLTPEEFETMKTHSMIGYEMLDTLPAYSGEPLVKYAREICRWHHERWDGKGYPDGLSGDEIPVSAQIVSLADVYDALTSLRCYKPPYSHEEAIRMIKGGECGCFNPVLLSCLDDIQETLKELKTFHGESKEENS